MTLDEYFHKIVNKQPEKETTMNFLNISMWFNEQIEKINSLLTKPVAFVEEEPKLYEDGYWAFEIYTNEWIDEFEEVRPVKHDVIIKDNDSTWHEVLDQILDVMGEHYGYNIKEQVYYSVAFPNNTLYYSPDGKPQAGYGRMLNDEILQKLLLAYPEVYELDNSFNWKPL